MVLDWANGVYLYKNIGRCFVALGNWHMKTLPYYFRIGKGFNGILYPSMIWRSCLYPWLSS